MSLNRGGIMSRNSGMPQMQVGVSSSAGRGRITPGPEIGREPEGLQIANSLKRFAAAGSNLGGLLYKEEMEKEQTKAVIAANHNQALPEGASALARKAYDRQIAVNDMQSFVNSQAEYLTSEEGSKLTEDQVRAHMAQEYDAKTKNMTGDHLRWFSKYYAGSQPGLWKAYTKSNTAYRQTQAVNAWQDAVLLKYRGLQALTGDQRVEAEAGADKWLNDQLSLPIMGITNDAKRGKIVAIASELARGGDDTLLKQLENRKEFQTADVTKPLRVAREAYDSTARQKITEANLAAHAGLDEMVASGATDNEVMDYVKQHDSVFHDKTVDWLDGKLTTARKARSKLTVQTHLDSAVLDGSINTLPVTDEDRNKAIDRMIVNVASQYPDDPTQGYLRVADIMVKNGYVSNSLKHRWQSIARSIPTTADGAVSEDFKTAYATYTALKDGGYGKMIAQFGESTVATFNTIDEFMQTGGMSIDAAAVEARKAASSPIDERTASRMVSKIAEETFQDNTWNPFDDTAIYDPIAQEEIKGLAMSYIRSGLVGGEDAAKNAMSLARTKYEENHVTLNGRPLNVSKRTLEGVLGTEAAPEDALKEFFSNKEVVGQLLDTFPDMGVSPDDVSAKDFHFMFSPNGKTAWVFYDDPAGITHMSGQTINTAVLGSITRAKEELALNKAVVQQKAENKALYDTAERHILMALQIKEGDTLGGQAGFVKDRLMYSADAIPVKDVAEWQSLSQDKKKKIITDLAKKSSEWSWGVPQWLTDAWDSVAAAWKNTDWKGSLGVLGQIHPGKDLLAPDITDIVKKNAGGESAPAPTGSRQPRGIRNSNPGNIRKGADWVGAVAGEDKSFVTFKSPEYGIRAMARILKNYESKYGLNTVRGIIGRWAPASENNVDAYVTAVAHRLGVDPNERIDVQKVLPQLIPAIIHHENGMQPYSDQVIQRGIQLEAK